MYRQRIDRRFALSDDTPSVNRLHLFTPGVMSTLQYSRRHWDVVSCWTGKERNMTDVDLAANARVKDEDYEIVINGSRFEVEDETVTYEQVVALMFPNGEASVIYSVAYRKAKGGHGGSGTLVPGTSVTVKKKGTSFDVTPTTRS
jgi:hypothetical protein